MHRCEAALEEVGVRGLDHLFNHPSLSLARQSLAYLQRLLKPTSNNNFNLPHYKDLT